VLKLMKGSKIPRIELNTVHFIIIIIVVVIIIIYCSWVVTRWQWLFYM